MATLNLAKPISNLDKYSVPCLYIKLVSLLIYQVKIVTADGTHSHNTFQKQIDNTDPKIYNNLPKYIKNSTVEAFKNKLKTWFKKKKAFCSIQRVSR